MLMLACVGGLGSGEGVGRAGLGTTSDVDGHESQAGAT